MAGPFGKKREAKVERNKFRNESVGYCPLARIDCVPRCVCYENACVRQHNMQWYAYGPWCNNPMLMRDE